jgi:4'-phosphopantetheinyl transferase
MRSCELDAVARAGAGPMATRPVMSWPMTDEPLILTPDTVDVLAFTLDAAPVAVAEANALLDPDERRRAARFRFPGDRNRYVVGRATVRGVLAAGTGEDPAQLRFTYNERGKPYLAEPYSRIHFNLAHTQGLAVLAVGLVPDIGVDVEATTSMTDLDDLAERCFSPAELRTYHTLPQPARTEAFYLAWTRKEAFIKATGEGLARPLDSFDVELVPDADPRFLRVPAGHDVEAWVLVHLEPAAGYVGALAVPSPGVTVRKRAIHPG